MDNLYEEEDIRETETIISDIERLIEREKSENESDEEIGIRELEEAIAHLKAFIVGEEKESNKSEAVKMILPPVGNSEVVDTGVLTGPMSGLKNFLIKKAQTNQ